MEFIDAINYVKLKEEGRSSREIKEMVFKDFICDLFSNKYSGMEVLGDLGFD